MPEFMTGTVDVPGAGKMKKVYIYVPAGLAAVYVGWRWYQAKQDAAAAPEQSDGTYTTADVSDYGLSTTGGATNVTGNTGSTETDATNPNSIDTNAEWTQKAVELLGNAGYDSATVYAALGEFLARRALDKSEASIARAALAAAGQPPVGGPYSVQEEAGAGTGTLPAPTNLRAWDVTNSSQVGMQWDGVPGAMFYRVYRTDLGTEPVGDSIDTKFWAKGLSANHSYSFYVVAYNTGMKPGGKSSVYTAKTSPVTLTKPSGLKASAITRTSFRVSCNKVTGAQYYRWYINGGASGASDQPYYDFPSRHPNTSYKISVRADTSNQNPGPMSSPLTVKTKK
jgi:hypothetical protein